MKLVLVAVGQRLPDWAQAACDDFAKRLPPEARFELRTVKAEPRGHKAVEQLLAAERARIEAALPKGARLVLLDERGSACTTVALARQWQQWQQQGVDVALLMGGPDGIDPALKAAAQQSLRLSDFTLPHALARLLLIEQLYRAWSLNAGHPYHRE